MSIVNNPEAIKLDVNKTKKTTNPYKMDITWRRQNPIDCSILLISLLILAKFEANNITTNNTTILTILMLALDNTQPIIVKNKEGAKTLFALSYFLLTDNSDSDANILFIGVFLIIN